MPPEKAKPTVNQKQEQWFKGGNIRKPQRIREMLATVQEAHKHNKYIYEI